MHKNKTITIEFEDYILSDKLHILAIEYATTIDTLVNIAVSRLVNDVEFFRGVRNYSISSPHEGYAS